jgi:hypothetical protein
MPIRMLKFPAGVLPLETIKDRLLISAIRFEVSDEAVAIALPFRHIIESVVLREKARQSALTHAVKTAAIIVYVQGDTIGIEHDRAVQVRMLSERTFRKVEATAPPASPVWPAVGDCAYPIERPDDLSGHEASIPLAPCDQRDQPEMTFAIGRRAL